MTISSVDVRRTYDGNGTTDAFATPYFVLDADLKVYVDGVLQILTTDYVLTGAGVAAGGTCTFTAPPASGTANVIILREPEATQGLDLVENDSNPAEAREQAFDKLTMIAQRHRDLIDRSFILPDTITGVSTELPAPAANNFVGWNGAADALINYAGVSGAATSTFMATVLDDITAKAAKETLRVQVAGHTTLRALSITNGERVYRAYHTTEGDGGYLVFRGVTGAAPGTYTENGGTIAVPVGGDGSSAWVAEYKGAINVAWFGACAGGDVYSALAAALAAGSIIFFPDGEYLTSDTLDFTEKTVYGLRRASGITTVDGVRITFTGGTSSPAVTVGGQVRLNGLAINRTGTGTRGDIIEVTSNIERTSYFKNLLLTGASTCFYANGVYIYSAIFENIEIGNYNTRGIYINSLGATGNVYTNIYSTNWLSYPTTKNTAISGFQLEGSHTEGVCSQLNIEHSEISTAAVIFSGVENFILNSVHFEGLEMQASTSLFNISNGALSSKILANGVSFIFSKFLGNDVRLLTINDGSGDASFTIDGFNSRNNDLNSTSGHRFALRGGSIPTNTPAIYAKNISGDYLTGNNYLPIAAETYLPVLREFNDDIYYKKIGSTHYMAGLSAAPSAGVYPQPSIIMNTAVTDVSDRGWHVWAKGDFSNPQHGTVSYSTFSSTMTPDTDAYAYFNIGDYILVSSVTYLITNKYGGNTFEVTPNTGGTVGTDEPCLVPDPQYRSIT